MSRKNTVNSDAIFDLKHTQSRLVRLTETTKNDQIVACTANLVPRAALSRGVMFEASPICCQHVTTTNVMLLTIKQIHTRKTTPRGLLIAAPTQVSAADIFNATTP